MLVQYDELIPLSSKTKLCFLSQSTCDWLHFSTIVRMHLIKWFQKKNSQKFCWKSLICAMLFGQLKCCNHWDILFQADFNAKEGWFQEFIPASYSYSEIQLIKHSLSIIMELLTFYYFPDIFLRHWSSYLCTWSTFISFQFY